MSGQGQRSPGLKLLFAALLGLALTIPLSMIYLLVYDRENQSKTAQAAINMGWGGSQILSGPIIVVPFRTTESQTETVNGKEVTKAVEVEKLLYISPVENHAATKIEPQDRRKSIYRSVLYTAAVDGQARFALPGDIERFGVTRERLMWDRAELRVGASDARGLTTGAKITANGQPLGVQPGKGPAASGGEGFFAFLPWDGKADLTVAYSFGLRGARSITLVPRGGQTRWDVTSAWASPSFGGSFLPDKPEITEKGFSAHYTVDKLALGQPPVSFEDSDVPTDAAPQNKFGFAEATTQGYAPSTAGDAAAGGASESVGSASRALTIDLIEPVNLYSKVNRSVKYGFLFIGFTFLTFLLFDVVGGARVAIAEYLLTGAGLVLFFVMLLAFAEVIGFSAAYVLASAAIIGLLSAYSAAVLKSWKRGRFVGAMLLGLYALLFVLLNLEAWSLVIGSVLLFLALAGVMYATRKVDWSSVGRSEAEE